MTQKPLRIVFIGTADFAVPSLEALIAAGHSVLAVVTQPDKPQGRGMQLVPSPVKRAAERLGLPLLQPRRVRAEAFIARMRDLSPHVLALAAFGQIVPQALLDIPPLGPINVHGSLLPKYRGAAPIQRALMAGETVTGVTTMWMDATLDTGDILLATVLPITPEDTSGTLFPKLAELGAHLLIETLEGLVEGSLLRQPQDNSQATLAPMIQPEESRIRWEESAETIVNRLRGLSPKPGVYTTLKERRVKVWWAQTVPPPFPYDSEPGTIVGYSKMPPGVLVAAGEGTTLLLTETQPENGKRMAADAWARGQRLTPGDRFDPDISHSS